MERVLDWISDWDDDLRLELAADILNGCDPNREILKKFINLLEENHKAELLSRLQEEEE